MREAFLMALANWQRPFLYELLDPCRVPACAGFWNHLVLPVATFPATLTVAIVVVNLTQPAAVLLLELPG